ncbi:unannotated protein [freshwater metagenome]|uniref:Unannotated protein n=1 Tax=freshwater metagenome TaxID=449393 RepID=A0A6J6G1W7_9ZZZZ
MGAAPSITLSPIASGGRSATGTVVVGATVVGAAVAGTVSPGAGSAGSVVAVGSAVAPSPVPPSPWMSVVTTVVVFDSIAAAPSSFAHSTTPTHWFGAIAMLTPAQPITITPTTPRPAS